MAFNPHNSILANLEPEPQDTSKLEAKKESKEVAISTKILAAKTIDNLNAASANFLVHVETMFAIMIVLNAGIIEKADKITYGYAITSIFMGYLLSYTINGGQPFFKGMTMIQAYIVQNQINQYGQNSIYLTCVITGAIITLLTAAKLYRINKVTPACILIGLKIAIGSLP